MNRNEIMTGIQDLRYRIETMHSEHTAFNVSMILSDSEVEYFDNILTECRMLVLQNEAADPHAP